MISKATKMKIKKGDNVKIIAGKDKGKEGKILLVDRKKNKVIVEGINLISKHQKPGQGHEQGGIIKKEAAIAASNVMFMHKGKPTRLGYKIEIVTKDGKQVINKQRIAKSTGELVD
jgi:large subunit ribosomal protein L24